MSQNDYDVYFSGLPHDDATEESIEGLKAEVSAFFTKCGVLKKDENAICWKWKIQG